MKKQIVHAKNAPLAIGPYSHAVRVGGLLFTSGQIAIDPVTGEVVLGGIGEQTRQVIENLQAVLAAAGAGLTDVVKTTCFLDDMNDFAQFNAVYETFFPVDPPARSCVAVERLPRGVLVEIEAVAVV